MKTIVGLFDNFGQAQSVVQDLINAGFRRDDISLVANDADGKYANYGSASGSGGSAGGEGVVRSTDGTGGTTAEAAGTGAKAGAYTGGALGLLVGLGALAVPGVGPVLAAGALATALGSTALGAGLGAATGGLLGALVGLGIPEEEAGYYSEGVRRGGTLVSVSAEDNMAQKAVDILNGHGAVDIEQRGDYYRTSGYSGYSPEAKPYTAEELTTYRQSNPNVYGTASAMMPDTTSGMTSGTREVKSGENVAIPIVEEQISVGKREVERGGARIHTRVIETPVSESVQLREEHVTVERHAVDRAVTGADTSFTQGTIEVRETAEVPVVAKEARVVEEVVIGKEATQRTETVSDTVRRTDVDVEEINTGDTSVTGTTTTGTTGTRGTTGNR